MNKTFDVLDEAVEFLVVATFIKQFQFNFEGLHFWNVISDLLTFFLKLIEFLILKLSRLVEITILHVFLHEFDLIHNILVKTLNVHFHVNNLGKAKLSTEHTLIFVTLNLLDLGVDLRKQFLEWSWIVNLLDLCLMF